MDNHDKLASEWDQSIAFLRRLDDCCQALNVAKFEGPDYSLWVKALWAFYLELSSNLHATVSEDAKKAAKKNGGKDPVSEHTRAEALLQACESGMEIDTISEAALFKRFVNAEKYLRTKMRERGLLIKMKKDPGSSLEDDQSY